MDNSQEIDPFPWSLEDEIKFIRQLPNWANWKNKTLGVSVYCGESVLYSYLDTLYSRTHWPFQCDVYHLEMLEKVVLEVILHC